MQVLVGGQQYEIDGILMGRGPVWWLIGKAGVKMTGPQFEALPEADKNALAAHVQRYIETINSGQAPS